MSSLDTEARHHAAELIRAVRGVPPPPPAVTPPPQHVSIPRGLLVAMAVGLGVCAIALPLLLLDREAPPVTAAPPVASDPPVLDQVTGSFVYLTTDTHLTSVDIDGATSATHRIPLAGGDPPYRLARRGDVLAFYGRTDVGSALYAVDPATPTEPTLLADAWFFIPSADEERVWVATLDPDSPDTVRGLESVYEIDMKGTITFDPVPTPNGRWPVGHVTNGLLFQGDDQLELWNPDSDRFIGALAGVFPVATWNNRIVTASTGDQVRLFDLDAGTERQIGLPPGVTAIDGYGGAFSPNGRYVAVVGYHNPDGPDVNRQMSLVLIDFDSAASGVVPGTTGSYDSYSDVAWSVTGERVFLYVGPTPESPGALLTHRPGDPTAYRVPIELEGPYYGMTAR